MARIRKLAAISTLLIAAPLLFNSLVQAQELNNYLTKQAGGQQTILGIEPEVIPRETPPEAVFALDEAVDPDEYVLAPGDVLGISMPRLVGSFMQVMVGPDGSLIIPNLAPIKVEGLTITEARNFVRSSFTNGSESVQIGLLQMRRQRVSVGGEIEKPGQYILTPADRAIVLVQLAGGTKPNAHKRRATIKHRDGSTENFDMLRYLNYGSLDANPRLLAGDHLIIQKTLANEPKIDVGGGVVIPGSYPWLESDHLLDVIEVGGGLLEGLASDTVIITRFTTSRDFASDTTLFSNLKPGDRGPVISAGDVVTVLMKQNFVTRAAVQVRGEVRQPGSYPIIAGETRLSEVIAKAGGFTPDAWLGGARIKKEWADNDLRILDARGLDSLVLKTTRYIDEEIVRNYSRFNRHDYYPTDFEKVFGSDSAERAVYDVVLYDSLTISVPRPVETVVVTGQVMSPGLISYTEGWGVKDYIKAAGGFAKSGNKSRVRVVPYESGVWLKAKRGYVVQPGDMVFVPEIDEDAAIQARNDLANIFVQTGTFIVLIFRYFILAN